MRILAAGEEAIKRRKSDRPTYVTLVLFVMFVLSSTTYIAPAWSSQPRRERLGRRRDRAPRFY